MTIQYGIMEDGKEVIYTITGTDHDAMRRMRKHGRYCVYLQADDFDSMAIANYFPTLPRPRGKGSEPVRYSGDMAAFVAMNLRLD